MALNFARSTQAQENLELNPETASPIRQLNLFDLREEHLKLSHKKNDSGDKLERARLSFEIREIEQSLMLGIFENRLVANAVHEEIVQLSPVPDKSDDDRLYFTLLLNAGVRAAAVYAFRHAHIRIPSVEELRANKADFYISESEAIEVPILCASYPGKKISVFTDATVLPPVIKTERSAALYSLSTLNNPSTALECRELTHREPVVIKIPYNEVVAFMTRTWN